MTSLADLGVVKCHICLVVFCGVTNLYFDSKCGAPLTENLFVFASANILLMLSHYGPSVPPHHAIVIIEPQREKTSL